MNPIGLSRTFDDPVLRGARIEHNNSFVQLYHIGDDVLLRFLWITGEGIFTVMFNSKK